MKLKKRVYLYVFTLLTVGLGLLGYSAIDLISTTYDTDVKTSDTTEWKFTSNEDDFMSFNNHLTEHLNEGQEKIPPFIPGSPITPIPPVVPPPPTAPVPPVVH